MFGFSFSSAPAQRHTHRLDAVPFSPRGAHRRQRGIGVHLILSIALCLGSARHVAGQSVDVRPDSGHTTDQHLPTPLVIAQVPPPIRPEDWSQLQLVQDCTATFERVLGPASLALDREARHDTLQQDNPWRPLSPAAIVVGRQCLSRFRLDEIPSFALPSTLQLAIALNTDSLVQAIVARQLAGAHSVAARAAVLDQAIQTLMGNHWPSTGYYGWYWTTAHVQLAHTYLSQLDALGDAALQQRIDLRRNELLEPAVYAGDVDAMLTLDREVLQLVQRLPPDQRKGELLQEKVTLLGVTYAQSLKQSDLQNYFDAVFALHKGFNPAIDSSTFALLLNAQAPSITCDDWVYGPTGGTAPTVPARGKISLLIFAPSSFVAGHSDANDLYATVRKIHTMAPDVDITMVLRAGGVLGQQLLVAHPEQEAKMLEHYYTDSVHLPMNVCVVTVKSRTTPSGHAVPLASPVWEAYRIPAESGPQVFIVDPTGDVLYDSYQMGDKPFGVQLDAFIHRLDMKFRPVRSTVTTRRQS